MSWSISASGDREAVLRAVMDQFESQLQHNLTEADKANVALILEAIELLTTPFTRCGVYGSGHFDNSGAGAAYINLNLHLSDRAHSWVREVRSHD